MFDGHFFFDNIKIRLVSGTFQSTFQQRITFLYVYIYILYTSLLCQFVLVVVVPNRKYHIPSIDCVFFPASANPRFPIENRTTRVSCFQERQCNQIRRIPWKLNSDSCIIYCFILCVCLFHNTTTREWEPKTRYNTV